MGYFVETRCDGFPWTRQGCNAWKSVGQGAEQRGGFVPYATKAEALAEIERMRNDRTKYDDPMWARSEYRVVAEKRRG